MGTLYLFLFITERFEDFLFQNFCLEFLIRAMSSFLEEFSFESFVIVSI